MEKTNSISRNRKILLTILFVSILTLGVSMLIYLDVSPNLLESMIASQGTVYANNSKVYIFENDIQIWNDRYDSDSVEFIYCLYGSRYKDGVLIEEMKTTEVVEAKEDIIRYKSCARNTKYLGSIHSHPQPESRYYRATCDMSKQDIYTFGSEGQALTGVICGTNQIAFYGTEDFENPLQIMTIGVDEK